MRRSINRRTLVLAAMTAAIGGVVIAPGTASANTARIGSALLNPPTALICGNPNCIGVQRTQVGGNSPLPLTSPANGVVTGWSVRTNDPDAFYTLRILRSVGGTSYQSVGSAPSPSAVPGTTTDSIIPYPAPSLPLRQGDAIGLAVSGAAAGLPQFPSTNTSDVIGSTTTFGDGNIGAFTDEPQHELLLQATIRFCNVPSVKGMKIKPAKQALTAADCTPKVKKKEARKKKNRAKVLKQKKQPGTTAAPGTVVTILVGKKPKA
jgi:PASTA domain